MTKIALVTGASKGIGLETVRQLTAAGVHVLLGARTLEKANAAAAGIAGAEGVQLDVTSEADIAAVAAMIAARFGHLDILINNAGVMVESGDFAANTTATIPAAKLRETFDSNFFGVVALTQALLPLVEKSEAGRIVNLSSILGSLTLHATPGSPIYDSKLFAYNVSKTALNGFTVHLAHALRGTAVKVNSAHPGWVKTDMGGAMAPMELEDGAKTSVQLAMLGADGPTGGYFHLGETLPW
jgi:NAD(P)-dependent dehydrogenase (short-subunit alcohol dehydrogenase family)